ncbi:MAG: glycosyltransferase family 2 protein [Candidatus Dependentiae bacterium]
MERFFFTFFLFFVSTFMCASIDKHFIVVTASYNNVDWYKKNLLSIFNQEYDNWSLIYIDDCSVDGTGEFVEQFVSQNNMYHKVNIIHNMKRMGHCYNQYHAIQQCPDDAIIVIVDGDDWLAHDGVFSYLNKVYQDDVWITYGQFQYYKRGARGCSRQIPNYVIEQNGIRDYGPWVTSHLRTFYAGLYKKIKHEHLMLNGNYLSMSVDAATMIPMIEMAGWHSKFIPDILYMYNDINSLSFFHDRREQQRIILNTIRGYAKYEPLQKLFH